MVKEAPRNEVMAVRLTVLDRQRLEFWAAVQKRRPATLASEFLGDAIRAALHQDTAPKARGPVDDDVSDAPVTGASAS
jgi:hypothetical protein